MKIHEQYKFSVAEFIWIMDKNMLIDSIELYELFCLSCVMLTNQNLPSWTYMTVGGAIVVWMCFMTLKYHSWDRIFLHSKWQDSVGPFISTIFGSDGDDLLLKLNIWGYHSKVYMICTLTWLCMWYVLVAEDLKQLHHILGAHISSGFLTHSLWR